MGNSIKYTTGTENNSLVRNNFRIGIGDVGKGPTSSTGFYKATAPPEGGYRIYLNNENVSGNVAYHIAANDSELISFTNQVAGQSYTTVAECFQYYITQTDKICINREISGIPTDGLYTHYDFGQVACYPYILEGFDVVRDFAKKDFLDIILLQNSPNYSSNYGGGIALDGSNDILSFQSNEVIDNGNGVTICMWLSNYVISNQRTPLYQTSNSFLTGFLRMIGPDLSFFSQFPYYFYDGEDAVQITNVVPVFICLNLINRGEGNYGCYVITNKGFGATLFGGPTTLSGSISYTLVQNPNFSNFGYLGWTDQNYYLNGTYNMFTTYNKSFFPVTTDVPGFNTVPDEIQQYYDATKGRFGL